MNDRCSSALYGSPRSCDDENACTSDSCDPIFGCAHEDTSADCDDGVLALLILDPIIGCTTELDELCDDNNLCTNDLCGSLVATTKILLRLFDRLDCTADSCINSWLCLYTGRCCL